MPPRPRMGSLTPEMAAQVSVPSLRQFIAARHAEIRGPQPSGDMAKMGDVPAGMAALHDYARGRGLKTDDGRLLVDEWQAQGGSNPPPPGPVGLTVDPSLDANMARRWGDDLWPQVRQAALDSPTPSSIRYPTGDLKSHLARPVYTIVHPHDVPAKSYADLRHGVMEVSPHEADSFGVTANHVGQHEAGHFLAPMPDVRRPNSVERAARQGALLEALVRDYPQLVGHPAILGRLGKHMTHASTRPERAAVGNHLRRLHYGVTGNPMITEADRIRAILDWTNGPQADLGAPTMRVRQMFPDDPVMKYGPDAGQPADGYNMLREYMRQIYKALPEPALKELDQTLRSGASVAKPQEVVHA